MTMATVLAEMPDLWQRTLTEHVPDETGYCRGCYNDSGDTAQWPCLSYQVAEQARTLHEDATEQQGRHAI